MTKTLIKIVKRKDLAIIADAAIQNVGIAPQTETLTEKKIESRLRREIAGTISSWINERRENSRREEIIAIEQNQFAKSSLAKLK